MGKKKDLSGQERAKIVKYLSEGCSTVDIARLLQRDHRTIKNFVIHGKAKRKRRSPKSSCKLSRREITSVKREMARSPLSSSSQLFKAVGLEKVPRSTRCRTLRQLGKVKKSKTRPPLNQKHKDKRIAWSKKYMKTDFSKVLWTDEMRATLDGPDGWARGWIQTGKEAPFRLKRQQGGGGVMIWAGILDNELVGPFRIEDGVKMNSETYCAFLERSFLPWLKKKRLALRKQIILMQDNAPSHASKFSRGWLESKGFVGSRLMDWPACSPDINCIENFWSALKQRVYANGKQFSSKDALWKSLQDAARSFSKDEIAKYSQSMDDRLISVIEKKGGYISK